MNERAVYNIDEDRWYKDGDDPWTVRVIPADRIVLPIKSVVADTYADAFLSLFGYPMPIPALVRSPRREVLA
jgi:hypothetical protein